MRCKRICRELLWLARFGEFGPSSAPHLDHLAGCGHCRDEVGFDRALVQQLRIALAARVEQAAPSAGAWGVILERAQAPDRGIRAYLHGQAGALAARLRTATAISAMALAGIIATSTHVAITHPQAGSAETEVLTNSAGELFERQPLLPRPRGGAARVPVSYVVVAGPSDPEDAFLVNASMASAAPADEMVAESVEPDVVESTVQSVILLGGAASRVAPLDPVGGNPGQTVEAPDAPADAAAAGEPF